MCQYSKVTHGTGSHAPLPTQPLTCHVNDVLGYGTFRPGFVLARTNMDVSAKSMRSLSVTVTARLGQSVSLTVTVRHNPDSLTQSDRCSPTYHWVTEI